MFSHMKDIALWVYLGVALGGAAVVMLIIFWIRENRDD